jgi:beta-barrel assembly-enhancing protease
MKKQLLVGVLSSALLLITAPSFAIGWQDLLKGAAQYYSVSNLSPQQEVTLGQQINKQLVSSEVKLNGDPRLNELVQRVGQRVAQASDRPNLPYTFQVAQDNSINAFATLGGFVYVTTGLLQAVAGDESELAGVLAHEVAHISAKHSIQQMKQSAIAQTGSAVLGLDQSTLVNIGVGLVSRNYGREDEYEADRLGVRTLARAGYPADGLPRFLKKLYSAGSPPEFLSTHPGPQNRVSRLEQMIRAEGLPTSGQAR